MSLFQIYCTAMSLFSITCNLMLIIITKFKILDAVQELRMFLANIALADIVLALCILAIAPQNVMRGTSTVRIPHGLLSTLPSDYLSMICALAVAVYMYIVLSYALLFMYRYAVMNSNSLMATILTGKNVLIFFGAIVIICAIEMALVHLSSVDTSYLWDKLNRTSDVADDFLYQLEFNRQPVILSPTTISPEAPQTKGPTVAPAMGSGVHQLENAKIVINVFGSDYKRNPMVFFSSGLLVAMNIIAYFIVFVCAYYILKSLTRKQDQMSKATRGVHEGLIKILFLESVFPLIFVIPPFIFYVLTLLDLDIRYPRDCDEYITTICIIMIPAVPPMLTFICVNVYKKAIIHLLTCSFLRATAHDNIAENATEDLSKAQMAHLKTMSSGKN